MPMNKILVAITLPIRQLSDNTRWSNMNQFLHFKKKGTVNLSLQLLYFHRKSVRYFKIC